MPAAHKPIGYSTFDERPQWISGEGVLVDIGCNGTKGQQRVGGGWRTVRHREAALCICRRQAVVVRDEALQQRGRQAVLLRMLRPHHRPQLPGVQNPKQASELRDNNGNGNACRVARYASAPRAKLPTKAGTFAGTLDKENILYLYATETRGSDRRLEDTRLCLHTS